ncbi:nitric oxide-sensing protein NosP [Marinospirillum perlucidum]|uniref:nitric oxide-sensing protein NosP n=1 Tax=Marinospirillum perlucidum TaxID=1982602 RepID=UPI000DF374FC|nr:nitric oxide-sensing protein NosP [Marinospirillum perlucidum]
MTSSPPLQAASSSARDPWQAAEELAADLNHPDIGWVVFFCSVEYDLESLAAALNHHFQQIELVGCTTAGELGSEGYLQGSITALGWKRQQFFLATSLLQPLEDFSLARAQQEVEQLQALSRAAFPEGRQQFAMTLFDGLSSQEELVLVTLNAVLGSIPHFGGSAGDDVRLANTHVFCQGAFHTRAAVLLLFTTPLPFEVFSTHPLQPLDSKLVVTEADASQRRVYELNAEPAAEVYARLTGKALDELTPEDFALNPLAVKLGQDYYVRSIQQINQDLSLTFYCAVGKGSVLTVMRPQPLLPDLQQQLLDIQTRIGPALMTLGCDCFLRRLELQAGQQAEEARAFFRQHRIVGFNTYGEHFAGLHVNQTFTGVVLGSGHVSS